MTDSASSSGMPVRVTLYPPASEISHLMANPPILEHSRSGRVQTAVGTEVMSYIEPMYKHINDCLDKLNKTLRKLEDLDHRELQDIAVARQVMQAEAFQTSTLRAIFDRVGIEWGNGEKLYFESDYKDISALPMEQMTTALMSPGRHRVYSVTFLNKVHAELQELRKSMNRIGLLGLSKYEVGADIDKLAKLVANFVKASHGDRTPRDNHMAGFHSRLLEWSEKTKSNGDQAIRSLIRKLEQAKETMTPYIVASGVGVSLISVAQEDLSNWAKIKEMVDTHLFDVYVNEGQREFDEVNKKFQELREMRAFLDQENETTEQGEGSENA